MAEVRSYERIRETVASDHERPHDRRHLALAGLTCDACGADIELDAHGTAHWVNVDLSFNSRRVYCEPCWDMP